MQQPAEAIEQRRQDALGGRTRFRVAQPLLDELQVPVAEAAPGEVAQPPGRLGEREVLQIGRYVGDRAVEAVQDPSILDRQRCDFTAAGL